MIGTSKWLTVGLLLLATVSAHADEPVRPTNLKTWQFQPASKNAVALDLTTQLSTKDGLPTYTLQIRCERACPTVAEESAFLRSVTRDMEAQGWSPRRVVEILLEAREPIVSERLARAAYSSKIWAGAGEGDYGKVVATLLNSSGAYKAFAPVFQSYGLTIEVSRADRISLTHPSKFGLDASVIRAVPSGATIAIALRPYAPD